MHSRNACHQMTLGTGMLGTISQITKLLKSSKSKQDLADPFPPALFSPVPTWQKTSQTARKLDQLRDQNFYVTVMILHGHGRTPAFGPLKFSPAVDKIYQFLRYSSGPSRRRRSSSEGPTYPEIFVAIDICRDHPGALVLHDL
jgi:hypothetical protein